ncbi:Nicotianamine synthase [Glonium stellatum]|uniref:Nicotianamine synthase n=1 Tax=Glonium stellatum TaxID=574774 RepID=A0A8E2FBL7_9PEZI|nr:Nicotianamine synthase [Glonium stellatum]
MLLQVEPQANFRIDGPSADVRNREMATKEAIQVAEEIVGIYNDLVVMADLRPGKEVNSLFSRLVEICVKPRNDKVVDAVLENKQIKRLAPQLRQICSNAEAELEGFWANRILCLYRIVAQTVLHSFPYYCNYIDLCRLECSTLLSFLPRDPQSIAFIGSGPLPLTSFCVADRFPSARIHNIDYDLTAIRVSSALALKLGYGERMSFSHEMAIGGGSLKPFDVVCLAALVGMDAEEKLQILADMARRMKHGTIICMRSAHSLRALLYPVSLRY